jgi:hypothetical protein
MRFYLDDVKELWPIFFIVFIIVSLIVFIVITAPYLTKEDAARMQGLAIGIAVGMASH